MHVPAQAFRLQLSLEQNLSAALQVGEHVSDAGLTCHRDQTLHYWTPFSEWAGTPSVYQDLPSAMPHGMVATPRIIDYSFSFPSMYISFGNTDHKAGINTAT